MPQNAQETLFSEELLNEHPQIIRRIRRAVGQNSHDQPDSIGEDSVATSQNADTQSRGISQTRLGYTLIANDTGTDLRTPGLGKFYIEGGTRYLTRVNSTLWQGWTGSGSWTTITGATLTSNLITNFVVAGNRQFLLNGTDNVFSTANGTSATDEGALNTSVPKSRFGIYHQNMLIVSGNSTNRSYIWPSTVLAPQTFDRAARAIKVEDQNGDEITALVEFSLTETSGFLAFKNRSINFVDTSAGGSDISAWSIIKIDPAHGCVGSRGAAAIGSSVLKGDCVYLSQEGVNYRLRSMRRTVADAIGTGGILSFQIENILEDVNDSKMSDAIVFYFNEWVFLAFPSGSSTFNDTLAVLDLKNSNPDAGDWKWSIWRGLNVGSISTYIEGDVEHLYFGDASTTAKVYRALSGTSDDGTAIEFIEEGRREDFGLPELYKSFQVVEVQLLATDDSVATVSAQIDGNGYTTLGTVSLESGGPHLPINLPFSLAAQAKIMKSFPLEGLGQGRDIQIKVTHDTLDKQIQLLGYILWGFLEPLNLEVRGNNG